MLPSLAARQRILLTARRSLLVRTPRLLQSTTTSVSSTGSLKGAAAFNKRKTLYTLGGLSLAAVGLLWRRGKEDEYRDDPRDVKALSMVPFGKLFSGWM